MDSKVTARIVEGDKPCPWQRDGYPATAQHHAVTLCYENRSMVVDFWSGSLAGVPTTRRVLECMLSDATSCYEGQAFEGWAGEYGMDTDSRKAEATFKACMRQTAELIALLGEARFDAVMANGDTDTAAAALAAEEP